MNQILVIKFLTNCMSLRTHYKAKMCSEKNDG